VGLPLTHVFASDAFLTLLCVQVPVHVYNSKLVRVYMRDLADEGLVSPSSNVLDLSSSQFFERTLQTIKDEVRRT
jgi:hypothetical protein